MELIATNISKQRLIFGLRWMPPGKGAEDKRRWSERFTASQSVTIGSGRSAGFGVVEGSRDNPISGNSAAAALAAAVPTSMALCSLTIDEKDYYWATLSIGGCVEFDVIGADFDKINSIISDRITDTVRPLLVDESDIPFFSDLSESQLNEIISLRDFNIIENDIYSLEQVMSFSRRTRINSSKLSAGSDKFDKKTITQIGVLVVGFIAFLSLILWPSDEEGFNLDSQVLPIMPSTPSGPTEEEKAANLVNDVLQDQLLGSKWSWVNIYYEKYSKLPSVVKGYAKSSMNCSIAAGRCEVVYRENNFVELNLALSELRPFFDNVVFSVDGLSITGVLNISHDHLLKPAMILSIGSLPKFDRGERLLTRLLPINRNRPGLTAAISTGEERIISYEDSRTKFPASVPNKYIALAWQATAVFAHQLPVLIDALSTPYLSINYIRITKTDNGQAFDLKGTYLMEPTQ